MQIAAVIGLRGGAYRYRQMVRPAGAHVKNTQAEQLQCHQGRRDDDDGQQRVETPPGTLQ